MLISNNETIKRKKQIIADMKPVESQRKLLCLESYQSGGLTDLAGG